jgi:hypothetical protein
LKFSKRPGFYLQDELEAKDYLKMKKINRRNLTKFLQMIKRNKELTGSVDISTFDSQSSDQDYNSSDDEN